MDDMRTFNLYDDPWVAVVDDHGRHKELTLRETFDQAASIRSLDGEIGIQDTAVTRFLLAFLYRALDPAMDEWTEMRTSGGFPMDAIDRYVNGPLRDDAWNDGTVESVHDRLFLQSDRLPFLQVADMESMDGSVKDPSAIMQDIRLFRGMQKVGTFTTVRQESSYRRITPGEAARWLLSTLLYDDASQRGAMKGDTNLAIVNGKPKKSVYPSLNPPASKSVAYVTGRNLFDTLTMNLIPYDDERMLITEKRGVPLWEREPLDPYSATRVPGVREPLRTPVDTVIDEYVAPSRKIRLMFDDDGMVDGVLLGCGMRMGSPRPDIEPMLAWRTGDPKKTDDPLVPVSVGPSSALWRSLPAFVIHGADGDMRPGVLRFIDELAVWPEYGIDSRTVNLTVSSVAYGTNAACINDIRTSTMSLPMGVVDDPALAELAEESGHDADDALYLYRMFLKNVSIASGALDGNIPQTEVDELTSELEAAYGSWVASLTPGIDTQEAKEEWMHTLGKTTMGRADRFAKSLQPGAFAGIIDDKGNTQSYGSASAKLWSGLHRKGML